MLRALSVAEDKRNGGAEGRGAAHFQWAAADMLAELAHVEQRSSGRWRARSRTWWWREATDAIGDPHSGARKLHG